MLNQKLSFRFEIDNFSEREAAISSPTFMSGGCEWYLKVHPKGNSDADDHVSLFIYVNNHKTLPTEWKRRARFYFVVLNQSNKELYKSSMQYATRLFSVKSPSWGFRRTLPLSMLEEELVDDRLIVQIYIKVEEASNGEGGDVLENKEIVDINGFQVCASKATSVRKLFAEHPGFAKDVKPKNKVVKTEYMNVLLNLIKTLEKPQESLPEKKRSKACSNLTEMIEAGFKLDWLKSKLGLEVSLEKKEPSDHPDVSQVQQLEERIKNLELSSSKIDSLSSKLEDIFLERKNDDCSWVQKLEESVKNKDVNSTERRKPSEEPYEAVPPQLKQLGKSVKFLEMMLTNLTAELDKEKAKSFADDFLLVD